MIAVLRLVACTILYSTSHLSTKCLGQQSSTAECWRAVDISLESTVSYDNPFLEVEVTATFSGPSNLTITRPAFWDGGNTWKVRFAPTMRGRWTYQTSCSDRRNFGLHMRSGNLEATPYGGRLRIYKHGFLKSSSNNRYLAHADNTPFFWMGDTHWFLAAETWGTANKSGWQSQFRGMVDKRALQKFSVYQTVIFGPTPEYWEKKSDGERINPVYFRNELDHKMKYIADRGLVNALGLGFHTNIDGNVLMLTRLATYVVARYGAYPMVWITGGEVGGYAKELRTERVNGWREVALIIDKHDSYKHPQTAHYTNDWPNYYQSESWFNFTMLQGGHGKLPLAEKYLKYYDQTVVKPILEAELNYEGIFPSVTDVTIRKSAYRAIQAGSFGYTYGAQGIWNAVRDDVDRGRDLFGAHLNWHEAIDMNGANDMTRLVDFYTAIEWQELEPRPHGWAKWNRILPDLNMPLVKADAAARTVVVYLPGEYQTPGPVGALLKLVPGVTYLVRWFNPRTGVFQARKHVDAKGGSIEIENKPDLGDWVLLLQATNILGRN